MQVRLQKILAEFGISSRRKAEELIREGRVLVNGIVAVVGMKADPLKDHIKVDGRLLKGPPQKIYLMMNKPRGVVTSTYDPQGRPTIKDFLKPIRQRVYPVGRLDYDSEGLLILTNDGEFAYNILHPSKEIPKTYLIKVKGIIEESGIDKLKKGIKLDGVSTAPAKVKKVRLTDENSWLQIIIHEGRKRQIRRMLEKIGHPVLRLKRISIGNLRLGDLSTGRLRHISADEIKRLKAL